VTRFQFVADHQNTFEVKRMCQVVQVSRSSFYDWQGASPARARRAAQDGVLAQQIRVLQDPAHGGDRAYGAPRITVDLNAHRAPDQRINHKKVARVMREHDLAGIVLRRRVRTTIPEQSDQRFPDLLNRDFTAKAPNCRYVGDITYVPLAEGRNLYLATVIDLFSRKLAGWALADHMRSELVQDALEAACAERGTLVGALFHSDHGSVYTGKDYVNLCTQHGVTQSMGAVGTSADNALAESFNATFKRETLAGQPAFADEATARRAVFRWATRYNTRRRHSWCGYRTPNDYEAHHHTANLSTAA
jgi:transposase InsO family protein